jgi:hypothetical protein
MRRLSLERAPLGQRQGGGRGPREGRQPACLAARLEAGDRPGAGCEMKVEDRAPSLLGDGDRRERSDLSQKQM